MPDISSALVSPHPWIRPLKSISSPKRAIAFISSESEVSVVRDLFCYWLTFSFIIQRHCLQSSEQMTGTCLRMLLRKYEGRFSEAS